MSTPAGTAAETSDGAATDLSQGDVRLLGTRVASIRPDRAGVLDSRSRMPGSVPVEELEERGR
jgi:hypothetical protein